MSAELHPRIAVLFDHELRAAAQALEGLHRMKDADVETKVAAVRTALSLAYTALYSIAQPDIQAIIVIDIRDRRMGGTERVLQTGDAKGTDANDTTGA